MEPGSAAKSIGVGGYGYTICGGKTPALEMDRPRSPSAKGVLGGLGRVSFIRSFLDAGRSLLIPRRAGTNDPRGQASGRAYDLKLTSPGGDVPTGGEELLWASGSSSFNCPK